LIMTKLKFGIGTKVNRSGYRGVVVGIRNKSQRYVKLASGEVCVNICDLKYWQKKSK